MTDTSQDIGYRNRSTPSGLVRRTYDVGPAPNPPASHTTYTAASLSNVPLPRTMTYTCTRTSPSSTQPLYQTETFSAGNPIRRSVSGMKTLLPLKLTSVAPDMGSWPQSAPSHRTTFGMRLSLRIERPSSTSESAENGKSRRKSPPSRPRRHRDTPIYTEPGVQLPGPAYLNANSIRRRCAPQDSTCDEACIINEYDEEKRRQHEHDLESFQETIDEICEAEAKLEATSQCSDLSFQCSGEDMFEDEASWLRSPLNIRNWPQPSVLPSLQNNSPTIESSVESWLSDTSSSFEEVNDQVACAAILAPTKANIVDVSLSPSSALSVKVPPRSSSLDSQPWPFTAALPNIRTTWTSFVDSPPNTPADGNNSAPSQKPSFSMKFQQMLPRRRIDLAMSSPPESPEFATLETPEISPRSTQSHALTEEVLQSRKFDTPAWPLRNESTLSDSTAEILTSLEGWTANFPSEMLLPESSCIAAIRSRLSNTRSQTASYHRPSRPLLSPSPILDFNAPPHTRSLRRRKTTDLSRHRRPIESAPPMPSIPIKVQTNHAISSTDLQPLHNIFPNSSKAMRASLYAYILAYIFVTSSLTSSLQPFSSVSFSSSPISPRQKRRDTPYWSTSPRPTSSISNSSQRMSQKAADILGLPSNSDPDASVFTSGFDSTIKAQSLQEELRKCIFCLISVMDENFGIENMMGGEEREIESSSGMVFLRSLIEVVRSAEERSCASPTYF